MKARKIHVQSDGVGLPVPPSTPAITGAGINITGAIYVVVGTVLSVSLLWLPLPQWATVMGLIMVGLAVGFMLVINRRTYTRMMRHARRWQNEPAYRAHWGEE